MSSIDAVNASSVQHSFQARGAGHAGMKKVDDSVANLLGMSSDELREARKSGSTLTDLAKQKGVSEEALKSTLVQALEENAPADAPSGIDFTQMASDIASGTGPSGPPPGVRFASTGENSSSGSLDALLEQFGVASASLIELLQGSTSSSSSTSNFGDDFSAQLQKLLSQYGSKGNIYDTKL